MTEIWENIKEYEGLYKISNFGGIKSLSKIIECVNDRSYKTKEKLMTPYKWNSGYLAIKLSKHKKYSGFSIHRLVAQAFIPNPENKCCVNHKNGIKTDNRVVNLEWVTYKENHIHARENNLYTGYEHSRKILMLSLNGNPLLKFDSITDACKSIGISHQTRISEVLRGVKESAHGYKWEYL